MEEKRVEAREMIEGEEERKEMAKRMKESWALLRLSTAFLKENEEGWRKRKLEECERIREEDKKDRLALGREKKRKYGIRKLSKEENQKLKRRTEERIEIATAKANLWKRYREGVEEMNGERGNAWEGLKDSVLDLEEEKGVWIKPEDEARGLHGVHFNFNMRKGATLKREEGEEKSKVCGGNQEDILLGKGSRLDTTSPVVTVKEPGRRSLGWRKEGHQEEQEVEMADQEQHAEQGLEGGHGLHDGLGSDQADQDQPIDRGHEGGQGQDMKLRRGKKRNLKDDDDQPDQSVLWDAGGAGGDVGGELQHGGAGVSGAKGGQVGEDGGGELGHGDDVGVSGAGGAQDGDDGVRGAGPGRGGVCGRDQPDQSVRGDEGLYGLLKTEIKLHGTSKFIQLDKNNLNVRSRVAEIEGRQEVKVKEFGFVKTTVGMNPFLKLDSPSKRRKIDIPPPPPPKAATTATRSRSTPSKMKSRLPGPVLPSTGPARSKGEERDSSLARRWTAWLTKPASTRGASKEMASSACQSKLLPKLPKNIQIDEATSSLPPEVRPHIQLFGAKSSGTSPRTPTATRTSSSTSAQKGNALSVLEKENLSVLEKGNLSVLKKENLSVREEVKKIELEKEMKQEEERKVRKKEDRKTKKKEETEVLVLDLKVNNLNAYLHGLGPETRQEPVSPASSSLESESVTQNRGSRSSAGSTMREEKIKGHRMFE